MYSTHNHRIGSLMCHLRREVPDFHLTPYGYIFRGTEDVFSPKNDVLSLIKFIKVIAKSASTQLPPKLFLITCKRHYSQRASFDFSKYLRSLKGESCMQSTWPQITDIWRSRSG